MYLQAVKSISSCTQIAPEMTKPKPNPGKMYALFACMDHKRRHNNESFVKPKCFGGHRTIKNIYEVIDLVRNMNYATVFNRVKWTTASENCTTHPYFKVETKTEKYVSFAYIY